MNEQYNIRPASEDPLGDPADQLPTGVLPASQDPLGDPALQGAAAGDYSDDEAMNQLSQVQAHPEFGSAVQEHLASMPPDQFQYHAEQAAQQMPPNQIQSVAEGLLGSLQARGLDIGQILPMLGLGSAGNSQFGAQDLARLLGWTQQNAPEALGDTASAAPGLLQQLGGPVVKGILSNLAGRLLGR